MRTNFRLIILLSIFYLNAGAQVNWQNVSNAPGSFVWSADTMNGKLYASFGLVYEYDGVNWTDITNYNNSWSTGNKTKSAIKCINGKVYAGAKDFNTSGEGAMHYFDGNSWTEAQSTDFIYHANYKLRRILEYNGQIYAAGNFKVPANYNFFDIARWNGTDWVDVGRNFSDGGSEVITEIADMDIFNGKLYITNRKNIFSYNGTTWDSLFLDYANPPVFPIAMSINDMAVFNNALYISGGIALDMTNTNVGLVKYNGSTFSAIARGSEWNDIDMSAYSMIGKLSVMQGKLYIVAKRADDNNTYLLSYDGNSVTQLTKLASSGDFTYAPGSEYTTYSNLFEFKNDLYISGNFQKIGGQAITGLVSTPMSTLAGIQESEGNKSLVQIFPNPGNGELRLKMNETGKINMKVKDLSGNTIREYTDLSNTQSINTGLNPGFYLFEVFKNGMKKQSGKFIVSK
jgi:hypothetical protein